MGESVEQATESPLPVEAPRKYKLRALRLAKGLSQEQLARMAGITQAMVSKIESDERGVGVRVAQALKKIFPEYEIEFKNCTSADGPVRSIPDHLVSVPIVSQVDLVHGVTMSAKHLHVPLVHLQKRVSDTLVAFRVIDRAEELGVPSGSYVIADVDDTGEGEPDAIVAVRESDVDVSLEKRDKASRGQVIGRIVWISYSV